MHRSSEVIQTDVASKTFQAGFDQSRAVSAEAAAQVKNGRARVISRETDESAIVLTGLCRQSRLIKVFARSQHIRLSMTVNSTSKVE
jgi:hypothetical protein